MAAGPTKWGGHREGDGERGHSVPVLQREAGEKNSPQQHTTHTHDNRENDKRVHRHTAQGRGRFLTMHVRKEIQWKTFPLEGYFLEAAQEKEEKRQGEGISQGGVEHASPPPPSLLPTTS